MQRVFKKVTSDLSRADSITKKIIGMLEKAEAYTPSSWGELEGFSLSDSIHKTASSSPPSVIPVDAVESDPSFENCGLGVFYCSSDKSIWRIVKDANGKEVLVRNDEYDSTEALVNEIMENFRNQ